MTFYYGDFSIFTESNGAICGKDGASDNNLSSSSSTNASSLKHSKSFF